MKWLALAVAIVGVVVIVVAHRMDKTASLDNDSFTTELFLAAVGLFCLTVAFLLLLVSAFLG